MKKTVIISLAAILAAACNGPEPAVKTTGITGKWTLTRWTAGFARPEAYKPGDILWEIKETGLAVTVNIPLDEKSQIPFKEPKVYALKATENLLTVEKSTFAYYFENDVLILDQGASHDAPRISFERIDQ